MDVPLVAVVVTTGFSGSGAFASLQVTVNFQLSPAWNSRPLRVLVAVRVVSPVALYSFTKEAFGKLITPILLIVTPSVVPFMML